MCEVTLSVVGMTICLYADDLANGAMGTEAIETSETQSSFDGTRGWKPAVAS